MWFIGEFLEVNCNVMTKIREVLSVSKVLLQTKALSKSYKMGTTRLKVLNEIDICVREGEFVTILGASGSGKSTLLHLMGSLDKPDSGTVIFEEDDLSKLNESSLNRYRNKRIGFVFQFYHLINELNVLENILMPAMAYCPTIKWLRVGGEYKRKAYELIEKLGLQNREKHKPYQLSGGERQRVAIGRALINSPALLLADEPTGNLDWSMGQEILSIFSELHRQGQTIVMVTHDQRVAQKADRSIVLDDGKARV